jgi:hypothetical protein
MTLYKGAKLNLIETDKDGKVLVAEWGYTLFEVIEYSHESDDVLNVKIKVLR